MADVRTFVDIFAADQDFIIRRGNRDHRPIIQVGTDNGVKIFLNDADLIRLRDVIGAHLDKINPTHRAEDDAEVGGEGVIVERAA